MKSLNEYHTKELLQFLNSARACGGWYSPYDKNGPGYTVAEIKEVLKTREHIPNKKEAKELRRKASKGIV
jgi:hypothetical protein